MTGAGDEADRPVAPKAEAEAAAGPGAAPARSSDAPGPPEVETAGGGPRGPTTQQLEQTPSGVGGKPRLLVRVQAVSRLRRRAR